MSRKLQHRQQTTVDGISRHGTSQGITLLTRAQYTRRRRLWTSVVKRLVILSSNLSPAVIRPRVARRLSLTICPFKVAEQE